VDALALHSTKATTTNCRCPAIIVRSCWQILLRSGQHPTMRKVPAKKYGEILKK
jgi:hypothetical protein